MAKELTAEQRAEYEAAFKIFDQDGDGFVTIKELGAVLKKVGFELTQQQLEAVMKDFDTSGDGKLSLDEFVKASHAEAQRQFRTEELVAAFKAFDKDGNGKISVTELKEAMKAMGENATEKEVEELIATVDANGDGELEYAEFVKLLVG